jgi:hypothetical protein
MSSILCTHASGAGASASPPSPSTSTSTTSRSRIGLAATLFAGLYIGALFAADSALPRAVRVAIALLPIPAFGFFLAEWIRGIRGLDELERRIQLEALAVAFPLGLVLVMGLGLIQRVTQLDPLDWSYRHIWPFLIAFYFFGLALARRRYR